MESALPRDGSIPRCCCGSPECAFLAHNSTLLEGLERDVSKAAQLGQALLVRHEAYVADSEQERRQLTQTIEDLEKEKLELEQKNAETIKANRELLDQLEHLNEAVATSDAHVKALTDTLHSTEEEIQRLASLAARTQSLERQLIDLEREQATLHGTLDSKVGDERTAIQRWRRAEKIIGDLQDQIDRIEKEAREERERHVEVVARMERRIAVEGELATAAGRLKAKAGQEKAGTNVVSHFVKDILLDNANLQHGILELREMLLNSNEEVELLRDQLRVHQPVVSPSTEDVPTPTPTLQKELGAEANIEPGITYPPPLPWADSQEGDQSTAATVLSQTAVTIPPNTNRWSNATTLIPGSIPGSPLSVSHRDSIYDRVFSDAAYDSSRPTSPSDSVNLASPLLESSKFQDSISGHDNLHPHRRRKSQSLKPPSLSTIRSVSTPISLSSKSSPATAIISSVSPQNSFPNDFISLSPSPHITIPEENEDSSISTPEVEPLTSPAFSPDDELNELLAPTPRRPTLRRAASHESLISVSGMDIHTLQSRPSQLLLSSSPRFTSHISGSSIQPEVTPWTATATASMSRRNLDSSTFNRSLLYSSLANQKRGIGGPQHAQKLEPVEGVNVGKGLGKKVGGWVWGKWGATPAPPTISTSATSRPASSDTQKSQTSQDTTTSTTTSSKTDTTPTDATTATAKKKKSAGALVPKLRPAGINQSGPIWGFFDDIPPTPTRVVVTDLDADALGEALGQ